jgi:NAD(P)-dependent dehydrogenase (short-subunit alcohol dehydrogenase family)
MAVDLTKPVLVAAYDINPGLVETQMLNGMLAQRAADTGTPVKQLKEGSEQMIPLGRLDEPEDIAAMVVFQVQQD